MCPPFLPLALITPRRTLCPPAILPTTPPPLSPCIRERWAILNFENRCLHFIWENGSFGSVL